MMVLWLLGCFPTLDNLAGTFPDNPRHDYDKDGLTEEQGDCDDLDKRIYKGNQEVCDFLDNDCDGNIDEDALDAPTWFGDEDGDGYGNSSMTTESCSKPDFYVDNFDDCDDSQALANPTQQEICDGFDNDCNGEVDEYSGVGAPTWYRDADGDGFGDTDVTTRACAVPDGYVGNFIDCDDSEALANPAQTEVCDEIDNNCNGTIDESTADDARLWYADVDGDGFGNAVVLQYSCTQPLGFVLDSTDCNDLSLTQYPNADEYCNGTDDDCDGSVDEGSDATAPLDAPTWYLDVDQDGFGDPAVAAVQCLAPQDHVADNQDCDDANPETYPNATEYCNYEDDNCDGVIDEVGALGMWAFYYDGDGDGHGIPDPSQMTFACPYASNGEAPTGYSLLDDDCNDSDGGISPSSPEYCTATVDENCDGDPTDDAFDAVVYLADSDGDGYGTQDYSQVSCSVPTGYVAYTAGDDLDCNDNDASVVPNLPPENEVCNGKLDRCENQWSGILPPTDEIDHDGDGYVECDVLFDPTYYFSGSISGGRDCAPNDAATFPTNLPAEADPSGCYLDLDFDGYGDVTPPTSIATFPYDVGTDCDDGNAVSYPQAPEICNGFAEDCDENGAVPFLESDDDGDGFVECEGYDSSTWIGSTAVVGGGDCNDSRDFTYPGAAYLSSPTECLTDEDGDGLMDLSWNYCPSTLSYTDASTVFTGEDHSHINVYQQEDTKVVSVGDVDGDGLDDVLISSPEHALYANGAYRYGLVYLVMGSNIQSSGGIDLAQADYKFWGEQISGGEAGINLTNVGDVDGDGLDDILIASQAGATFLSYDGRTYLIYASSLSNLSDSDGNIELADSDVVFVAEENADHAWAISGVGDVDGDGLKDFAIGAKGYDSSSWSSSGKVYLITAASLDGSSSVDLGTVDIQFEPDEMEFSTGPRYFGYTISGVGDVNGDGFDDVLIGHLYRDVAYLFFGDPLWSGTISTQYADYHLIGNSYGSDNDKFSMDMTGLGDVDGDGLADFMVSSPYLYRPGGGAGRVNIYLSSSLPQVADSSGQVAFEDADYFIYGEVFDRLGYRLDAGDLTGDGISELVFGAGLSSSSIGPYETIVFDGASLSSLADSDGEILLSDASYVIDSPDWSDVAFAGDVNGDGTGALIIGTETLSQAYLFTACE